jgi:hypothetical protein
MIKKVIILLLLVSVGVLAAQPIDDMIFQTEKDTLHNDIITVNFEKKDAQLAMVMSAILPGAGQFYADKSSLITFVFPVVEAAMIGGMIYFNHRGNVKTDDFENYATGDTITQTFVYTVNGTQYDYTYTGTRYRREYQDLVQTVMTNINAYDIYDGSFFRLDSANTQHFYEDIGKYNKYIFGWSDWYFRFATDPTSGNGSFILDDPDYEDVWLWSGSSDPQLIYKRRWEQNYTIEDYMNGLTTHPVSPGTPEASPMRQVYIDMRKLANKEYTYARVFGLGLAFNHIASAVDAVILTNKVNRSSLTQNDIKFYYYAGMRDNKFTPGVGLRLNF